MARRAKQNEEEPWWHEDATEFAADDDANGDADESSDSSELLTTATQEAVKLAATLSTWAEQTGFGDVLRSVAKQAVDTAQDAATSLMDKEAPVDADLEEDFDEHAEVQVADLDAAAFDLESEDYAHLDDDPADAGVVQFNSVAGSSQAGGDASQGFNSHTARITCDYCPVCRVIESLDDLNPETAAAIAEVMAVVTDGVASAVMDLVPKSSNDDS